MKNDGDRPESEKSWTFEIKNLVLIPCSFRYKISQRFGVAMKSGTKALGLNFDTV